MKKSNIDENTMSLGVTQAALRKISFEPRETIIEDLLVPGTLIILAGDPKVGKSFLGYQLCYCVACGIPFLGKAVKQVETLLIDLENGLQTIYERDRLMYAAKPATDKMHIQTEAESIKDGFLDNLKNTLKSNRKIKLVVIDTYAAIMGAQRTENQYYTDHQNIRQFSELAQSYGVSIVLVHHTRKMQSDNPADRILGTNGFFGASDGAFLLLGNSHHSNRAILKTSMRHLKDINLPLCRNVHTQEWELYLDETEKKNEEIFTKLQNLLNKSSQKHFEGTITELCHTAGINNIAPNQFSRLLREKQELLFSKYKLSSTFKRNSSGSIIILDFIENQ